MSNESTRHRVVIFAAPDDPYALRDVLVEVLGLHPTEAQIRAHDVPGVLPERLSRDEALRVVAAVEQLGVSAASLPDDEVPEFEHAEIVHHARCLDAGLEIVELHGEPECVIPWSDVELVSVGRVPLDSDHRYLPEQDPVMGSGRRTGHKTMNIAAVSGPEMWLIRRHPMRGFRINHKQMNYEYLGNRMTDSASKNFLLFVSDLLERAPDAYRTPATRAFCEHGLLGHYDFRSSEQLRLYTVFHLLLLHRMRSNAGE